MPPVTTVGDSVTFSFPGSGGNSGMGGGGGGINQ